MPNNIVFVFEMQYVREKSLDSTIDIHMNSDLKRL